MKNLHAATQDMAVIATAPAPAGRLVFAAGRPAFQVRGLVFVARGLVVVARGLVILASGLVMAGAAMSADTGLERAQYREAVKDVNASYQAHLLQCNSKSRDERSPCRREARAARTEALAAAKTRRVSGTGVDTSKPPNPETPSGLKASKTDIAPQLQRDSPPDIVPPKKK